MKNLLCIALLLLNSLSLAQTVENLHQIDQMANHYVSAKQNHGLVIGIIQNGRRNVLLYGETQKGNGQTPTPYNLFEIGELSSLFTTGLLAQMTMDGSVNLDTPLQSLMPANQRIPVYLRLNCSPMHPNNLLYACEPKMDDETIPILLCDLATHTAGLPRNPRNLKAWRNAKNPYAHYQQSHLYYFLNNYPIQFTGDLQYSYSNVGMAVLGHALSRTGALPFDELLVSKVLRPLGMHDTRLRLSAEHKSRFLTAHNRRGKETSYWDSDIMAPAIGIRSTPTDMMTFLAASMGLNQDEWYYTFALTHTPRTKIIRKELAGSQAGLGWLISPVKAIHEDVIWQAGTTGGFASYIGILKQSGIGVVILSNSATPVNHMGREILQVLYASLPPSRTVMLPK